MMQKLEGLQYDTALDLNMWNCIIDLFPRSRNLKNIVTAFGKFRYNRVPVGLCAFVDIFQSKVGKFLGDIEGVKTYIDNILVLGKGILLQHIYHPRIIFANA